jgi:hypothetical protein
VAIDDPKAEWRFLEMESQRQARLSGTDDENV